ncbi:hypothetical protein QFC24_000247 [Naganishia onofrii]|uniref:Uncharacterized protein n=1 Tax=Naganishia onofrii TaxID=1851511 RepID=A0ACC2XXP5_9TREE|nr:hypothetical protein QFC24_000247 [Naganishia onofrii]
MAPVDRASRPMIVGPPSPEPPYPLRMVGKVTKGFGRGSKELGIPTANLPDDAIGGLVHLGFTGVYYGFARVYPEITDGATSAEEDYQHTPLDEHTDFSHLSSTFLAQLPQHTAAYPPSSTASSAMPSRTSSPAPTLPTIAQASQSLLPSRHHKKRRLQKEDYQVWPMVMSVGWNPYYKNEKLTAVSTSIDVPTFASRIDGHAFSALQEVHIMHQFPTNFYGHTMAVVVLGYIRPELDYISKGKFCTLRLLHIRTSKQPF